MIRRQQTRRFGATILLLPLVLALIAVIAAVVSSTLRTLREQVLRFFLSFCIMRNDWEKSLENLDLIQEELEKGLLIANSLRSSSRTRLRKCNLLTDLIQ